MKPLEAADLFKTIDETVALMINLDYIPSGVSLLEMTEAYLCLAEENYERAKNGVSSYNKLEALKLRMESCRCRHELAQSLIAQLTYEAENLDDLELESPDDFMIDIDNQSPPRIGYVCALDWACDNLGINIPNLLINSRIEETAWEDVTIKIYKDYRIGCQIRKGKFVTSSFNKKGLMGKNKKTPNELGGILIGLSEGRKYPKTKKAEAKDKTAISKLRNALMKLTVHEDDPFYPITEADGWKPRFKLIDDRRNADERAKREAIYEELDENKDYSKGQSDDFIREKDPGQDYIDKNS